MRSLLLLECVGIISVEVVSMPLYEYQCQACGLRFERRQSFNDEPISICPECEGPVQRLISPVGIIFKGSGFYVTDNRGKSSTRIPTKSEKEESSKKEKTASSETKNVTESSTTSKKTESKASTKESD